MLGYHAVSEVVQMNPERRKFLQQLAAVCAGGVARTLGIGCTSAVVANAGAAAVATTAVAATGAYGLGVRSQVFEVIVRQAMAGAPWKEICQGPMQVNQITEAEIQAEVARRSRLVHVDSENCQCSNCVVKRLANKRSLVLSQIPHSEKSPCACPDCLKAVHRIIAENLEKSKFPKGLA
ncbi:MAG: hypothetical protein HYX67_00270 [Candidatus Melainabacteria bacterium]|nr:hypothetical protein [Candidatus Melainabacteria bacterium]